MDVLITGNTFPVKEELKKLGGRWDSTAQGWKVPAAKAEEARTLVAQAPVDSFRSPNRKALSAGELWQECRKSGCETEPVCLNCEYYYRHCRCS